MRQDDHYMQISKDAAEREAKRSDVMKIPVLTIGEKASNPKDAISNGKVPLHIVPFTAVMGAAIGLLHGLLKYGRMNWRSAGVRATVYSDAISRHNQDWMEGNDVDEDGCDNLFAIAANVAILIDARAAGKLNDDRNVRGANFTDFKKQMEAEVIRLKAYHADKSPKHYTIADNGSI